MLNLFNGLFNENQNKELISSGRIYFLVFLVFVLTGIVFWRLYFLQIKNHEYYRGLAIKQHKSGKEILPKRGDIYLQEKSKELFPVAVSRELKTVFIVPEEIDNKGQIAKKLSEILGVDEGEILIKASKEKDLYEVIKGKISKEEEEEIVKADLPGVHFESDYWRYYQGEKLAAQTVGFIGYDKDGLRGLYGLERQFERELKGMSGKLEQERDTLGRWISVGEKSLVPAKDGKDLVLTIDHVIQFKTDSILENAVKKHDAQGGKIIVLDPYSGGVLALSSYPSFDPNEYSKVEVGSVFRNPVINDEYECGSVFKPITMAIGIDNGSVQPDSTYIDTGAVKEAGFTIMNSDEKAYGQQTMTQVIEKSLNTGTIFIQKKVGNELFLKYLERFGFGEKTGIAFPFEIDGNLSNLKTAKKRNIEYYTASFGQGITVTPLQLAVAYGALANGGDIMEPKLVEYFMDKASGEKDVYSDKIRRTVISKDTANKIGIMLENNVKNGHGKLAGVPGYRVSGKTGTAQIADRKKGGYLKDAHVGTFTGFAPTNNPRFVMVVIIDHPKDVEWAESSAAPVFGELSKFIFDYYGIAPTEDYKAEDLVKFSDTHRYFEYEDEEKEEIGDHKKEEEN